ncbi:MAG: M20/M25/M40 family metallo-hydrolase [Candidatus Krumholzibacteria bacterium]|nr:M20/M25/M40 family metallo-hydrolase [Candidatus Krumholzibacteria bacterium]
MGRNIIADLGVQRCRIGIGLLARAVIVFCAVSAQPADSASLRQIARHASPIVDKVDASRLERVVRALSGADSIEVDGKKARIRTRYALSPEKELARRYLENEVRDAGYEPSVQKFMLGVKLADLTGMAISGDGDTIWVADAGGETYMATSALGWASFERVGDIDQYVYGLYCDPLGRLWAACGIDESAYGGLYISTDGGASWSLRFSGSTGSDVGAIGSVAFGDSSMGMAGGANGTLLRTPDGGETWTSQSPASFGNESIDGIAATGPTHFWLITANGSLYETTTFGSKWTKTSLMFGRLSDIDFSGERAGVIVGTNTAFYTKNGGGTWTSVSVPTRFTAVSMEDSLRVIAAGTDGEIWSSEDGGATWALFETGCRDADDVWHSAISPDGCFWLAGRNFVRRFYWDTALEDCTAYQFSDTIRGENISFCHEGVTEPNRRVFVTAHWDSYSGTPYDCAPGADDNGTGTAAVLECARALRDERTERTVEFVLFDAEELGLKGSRYFANSLDTLVEYDGDLQLDMIGYEPEEELTAVIFEGTEAAQDSNIAAFIETAIDSFHLGLEVEIIKESAASDQISFWNVGIPAVLFIEGRRSELTPYYHSCTDVAEHLNFDFFEVCTKAALGAAALMAGILPPEPSLEHFALYQNYPNPFNAGTTVSFAITEPAEVELAIYDIAGRRVALIERAREEAGAFERRWDGRDAAGHPLASGVYFLRLKAGAAEAVRKIVILR